jgi:hypothetical protein
VAGWLLLPLPAFHPGCPSGLVSWPLVPANTLSSFPPPLSAWRLQGIMQEAVTRKEYWRMIDSQGRPPGVLGIWPSRAITFLENHDTGGWLGAVGGCWMLGGWVLGRCGCLGAVRRWVGGWVGSGSWRGYLFIAGVVCVAAADFGGCCWCWRPEIPSSYPLHSCPKHTRCLPSTPPPALPHPSCAGSTLNHWPFPWKHLPEGYCYLLTHPGTPCVFYDHLYSDAALKTHILELMKIRKKHGINAKSEVGAGRCAGAGGLTEGWFDGVGAGAAGWVDSSSSLWWWWFDWRGKWLAPQIIRGRSCQCGSSANGQHPGALPTPAYPPAALSLPAPLPATRPALPAACRCWCARPTTSCMRLSLTRRWQ